jgi:hypothetical protein
MVTAFQTKSRKAIAPAEMAESDRLEHLGITAKTIHREIEKGRRTIHPGSGPLPTPP